MSAVISLDQSPAEVAAILSAAGVRLTCRPDPIAKPGLNIEIMTAPDLIRWAEPRTLLEKCLFEQLKHYVQTFERDGNGDTPTYAELVDQVSSLETDVDTAERDKETANEKLEELQGKYDDQALEIKHLQERNAELEASEEFIASIT